MLIFIYISAGVHVEVKLPASPQFLGQRRDTFLVNLADFLSSEHWLPLSDSAPPGPLIEPRAGMPVQPPASRRFSDPGHCPPSLKP